MAFNFCSNFSLAENTGTSGNKSVLPCKLSSLSSLTQTKKRLGSFATVISLSRVLITQPLSLSYFIYLFGSNTKSLITVFPVLFLSYSISNIDFLYISALKIFSSNFDILRLFSLCWIFSATSVYSGESVSIFHSLDVTACVISCNA